VNRARERDGLAAAFVAGLLATAAAAGTPGLDGPVPGHTGGFGEPTCHACHADGPEPAVGGVSIQGLPERFVPGKRYQLTLVLDGTPTRAAGFQLAVRGAPGTPREGEQAGVLAPAGERARVREGAGGVQYLSHSWDGVLQPEAGQARWSFTWTAPADMTDVAFHVAANYANDDASELGDIVRTGAWRLRLAEKSPAHLSPTGTTR